MLNDVADHKRNEFVTPIFKMLPVDTVIEGTRAKDMGLAKGDSIIAINGVAVVRLDEFQAEVAKSKGKEIKLDVSRAGVPVTLVAAADTTDKLGFNNLPIVSRQYSFAESLPIGINKAVSVVTDNIKGFGKIFKGEIRADKALSGPVGIAKMFGTTVDWVKFWTLVGTLSMALAFMNLLPIPALDGGHVVFLLIEMIQGKPVSEKVLETAQMIGFFILIALMIFTFGNDIIKW